MSPLVNTEVKMPKKLFDALVLHEAFCVVSGIESVDEAMVKNWIAERFNQALADQFNPEYLLNNQAPLASPQ